MLHIFSATFFSYATKADSYDDFYKRTKSLINSGKHDPASIEKIKNETIGQSQLNAANEVNRQIIESNKNQLAKKLRKVNRTKKTPETVDTIESIMKRRNAGKGVKHAPVTTATTTDSTTTTTTTSKNTPVPNKTTESSGSPSIQVDHSNLPGELTFPGK